VAPAAWVECKRELCLETLEHSGGTYTTGGKVANHPPRVTITLLLVAEHGLEGVAEREVEGLGREVTDDVGRVATPQRDDALVGGRPAETVGNAIVLVAETAGLDHLVL